MCQSLEENVADLQEQLRDKDSEITILRSQVNFLMAQQQTLVKALRYGIFLLLFFFTVSAPLFTVLCMIVNNNKLDEFETASLDIVDNTNM